MKKIFYIINSRLPTEKANGYQVCQMVQAFKENGLDIQLLKPCRKANVKHVDYENRLKDFYNLRLEPEVYSIWSIDFLFILQKLSLNFSGLQFIGNLLHSVSFVIGLTYFFWQQKNPAIIYIRDVNIVSWLYPFLPSLFKKNIYVELHYLPESLHKKNRYIRILNKAQKVICITHRMQKDLIELGYPQEKTWVEHDGVDLETFDLKKTQMECRKKFNYPLQQPIIGYVGNFHTNGQEKGIDDLIKAAALVFKQKPQTLFCFVGGPMDRVPYYQKLIADLHLPQEQFMFFDRRPLNEVPLSMQACDILVIPLPWNPHFAFYMSPMKLFEYMASQRCIVATDVDGVKEILKHKHNALLATHSNTISLADHLIEALNNPELRNQLALQAFQDVQQHTWKLRAQRIIQNIL